jgi:hypothetical protein
MYQYGYSLETQEKLPSPSLSAEIYEQNSGIAQLNRCVKTIARDRPVCPAKSSDELALLTAARPPRNIDVTTGHSGAGLLATV